MKIFSLGALCALAIFVGVLLFSSSCLELFGVNRFEMIDRPFESVKQISKFFPSKTKHVEALAKEAMDDFGKVIDQIKAIPRAERKYQNTFDVLDRASRRFNSVAHACSALQKLSPEKEMRQVCQDQSVVLGKLSVDLVCDKEMFVVLSEYDQDRAVGKIDEPELSEEQQYFIKKTLEELRLEGLELDQEPFERFKVVQKELLELEISFEQNINNVTTKLSFDPSDLEGMSMDFIATLGKDKDGKLLVGLDRPAAAEVLSNCSVASTRERFYLAYNSRAWPDNEKIFENILRLRAEVAQLLGKGSFAHVDTQLMMAGSPERVNGFLDKLLEKAAPKMDREFELLKQHLPAGVQLDEDGNFKLWDLAFVKEVYKKEHLDVDQNFIKEFFPLESTIEGLFKVYQDLLSVDFVIHKDVGLWDPECTIVEVVDRDKGRTQGYVVLDLHPRDNKYSHACHARLISSVQRPEGFFPRVALVIANLPKRTAGKPALLRLRDVSTFFHEFGHAMHGVLGTTQTDNFSGTRVLRDFVETPSMMFEEWLWEANVLKKISSHYQSDESLPDTVIDKLLVSRNVNSGWWFSMAVCLSRYALLCHGPAAENINLKTLWVDLFKETLPGINPDPIIKMHASWGHLTGYAAKFYTYMWSLVFACDLFEHARELGLESPEAGKKIRRLLSKGGSVRPEVLLEEFLGRPPSMDALAKRWGLDDK